MSVKSFGGALAARGAVNQALRYTTTENAAISRISFCSAVLISNCEWNNHIIRAYNTFASHRAQSIAPRA